MSYSYYPTVNPSVFPVKFLGHSADAGTHFVNERVGTS